MQQAQVAKRPKRRRRPIKGALIKGVTGRLPVNILSNPVFEQHVRSLMKGHSGIYLLYKRKSLHYVGIASKNLLGRLNDHQADRHAGKWDRFVVYRIRSVRLLKDLETLLITLLNPPGNANEGRVPKDADMNRVLRKVLKEGEGEIRIIRKALSGK
jgi:hypothetical protein